MFQFKGGHLPSFFMFVGMQEMGAQLTLCAILSTRIDRIFLKNNISAMFNAVLGSEAYQ